MNALPVVCLALAVAAPSPKDPPKQEAPSLTGSWTITALVVGGKQQPGDGMVYEFLPDGTLNVHDVPPGGTGDVLPSVYTTNPRKDPAEIDILGPGQVVLCGIYKRDGDTLMFCFNPNNNGKRPTKFESAAGSKHELTMLKRIEMKD